MTCSVEGCEKRRFGRGWCAMHYGRMQRHGSLEQPKRVAPNKIGGTCSVDGCDKPFRARGYCDKHYQRWQAHGDPLVLLTRGPGSAEGWLDTNTGYRKRYVPGRGRIAEHRLVMERILGRQLEPNENVHHINGDRADNRPENLEVWVTSQPKGQRVEELIEYVARHHASAVLNAIHGTRRAG